MCIPDLASSEELRVIKSAVPLSCHGISFSDMLEAFRAALLTLPVLADSLANNNVLLREQGLVIHLRLYYHLV